MFRRTTELEQAIYILEDAGVVLPQSTPSGAGGGGIQNPPTKQNSVRSTTDQGRPLTSGNGHRLSGDAGKNRLSVTDSRRGGQGIFELQSDSRQSLHTHPAGSIIDSSAAEAAQEKRGFMTPLDRELVDDIEDRPASTRDGSPRLGSPSGSPRVASPRAGSPRERLQRKGKDETVLALLHLVHVNAVRVDADLESQEGNASISSAS